MKRLAVFGGTFNPIHNGHLHLCKECAKQIYFDKILLMPTNLPPHKQTQELAKNQDRLEMCRLAVEHDPLFEVSDLEMQMQGISYTVNTLRRLKEIYSDWEIYFIIGSDMLFMFHRWISYQEILEMAHLLVGARAPREYDQMVAYTRRRLQNYEKVHILHIPVLPISSTEIRRSLDNPEWVLEYLNPKVYDYIREHRLYQMPVLGKD